MNFPVCSFRYLYMNNDPNITTHFASPFRSNQKEINSDFSFFSEIPNLSLILNTIPNYALILNENRQIVYSNKLFNDFLEEENTECIIAQRPGEAIRCIHSEEMDAGCGTTEACRECGVVQAIIQSLKQERTLAKEARVSLIGGQSLDLQVWASPFTHNEKKYILAIISDISTEKRKRALERIFFHDILNVAGALNSYMEIIEECDENERGELLKHTKSLANDLIEEITAQKNLSSLENGEYEIHISGFETVELIGDLVETFSNHSLFQNKIINTDKLDNVRLRTDKTLLKRVLFNLIKNALEAIAEGREVSVGCEFLNSELVFHVSNPGIIPPKVRLQIFQRSFSTKGEDRGLGTYSIKLLTEKYLKGRVYFESAEDTGTVFYIVIPIDLK